METSPSEPGSTPGVHLLAGGWRGRGVSEFPTIERVEYVEEFRVEWDPGREILCYEQRATLADGSPSHRESGFIRTLPDGVVEMWNAQDNGRTEVMMGSSVWDEALGELTIDVRSTGFANDPRMLESRRILWVSEGGLRYEMSMATTTTPEPNVLPHLAAELTRVPSRADDDNP